MLYFFWYLVDADLKYRLNLNAKVKIQKKYLLIFMLSFLRLQCHHLLIISSCTYKCMMCVWTSYALSRLVWTVFLKGCLLLRTTNFSLHLMIKVLLLHGKTFWRYLTRVLIWYLRQSSIRPSICYSSIEKSRWNQSVLINEGKVPGSRKQQEPLI